MDWKTPAGGVRDSWDARAEQHLASWYRLDGFKRGESSLDEIQLSEVGGVSGRCDQRPGWEWPDQRGFRAMT